MGVMYYILSPFSWLLNFFYSFTDSYGISLILFALVIKIILFPLTIKGKKGMIQMNLLSGKMQQLQKQYGKDRERYNMEVQRLYEREKVNPMSGCLWSFLPILILLPLYAIIRQPLLYLMGLDSNRPSGRLRGLADAGREPRLGYCRCHGQAGGAVQRGGDRHRVPECGL